MKIYFIISLPVLIVFTLVILKSLNTGTFHSDAEKWARPSVDQSNLITGAGLKNLQEKVVIVDVSIDHQEIPTTGKSVHIPADKITDKEQQRFLHGIKGSIVLTSDDPSLTSRIWMILSQMGYKKLYILQDSVPEELFKYKFRPDSMNRPESQVTSTGHAAAD
jgi:hypothetical protein